MCFLCHAAATYWLIFLGCLEHSSQDFYQHSPLEVFDTARFIKLVFVHKCLSVNLFMFVICYQFDQLFLHILNRGRSEIATITCSISIGYMIGGKLRSNDP